LLLVIAVFEGRHCDFLSLTRNRPGAPTDLGSFGEDRHSAAPWDPLAKTGMLPPSERIGNPGARDNFWQWIGRLLIALHCIPVSP
jgi:hypothetical protein